MFKVTNFGIFLDKSGVRFAPKVKQRRSITGTPVTSRRPSVTPTPDGARKSIDNAAESGENVEGQDSNEENSDEEGDSKLSTIELPKPQETKQRRLSTLNNISNRDLFKKVSVKNGYTHDSTGSTVERKTHIIGIPHPQPPKRRRSTVSQSRRGSAVKRKSVSSETPAAPESASSSTRSSVAPSAVPDTVEEDSNEKSTETSEKVIEFKQPTIVVKESVTVDKGKEDEPLSPKDSSSQDIFTSSLPIPSTLPSSVPSSAPESSTKESQQPTSEKTTREIQSADVSKEQSPMPIGVPILRPSTAPALTKAQAKAPESESSTPAPEPEDKGNTSVLAEGLFYDKDLDQLKKKSYDPTDDNSKEGLITSFQFKKYDQISRNFNSLSPELLRDVTIDEETFTISDLCKPTLPIGKISSNFHQAQEARKSKMKQRQERKLLRRRAKEEKVSLESLTGEDGSSVKKERRGEDGEEDPRPSSSNAAIQLTVGADDQIIIDEESRVVDRHPNIENDDRERFNQNPFENVVNSATYGRQRYTDKWDKDDVEKFYRALGQWGTDFGLIAQMFPHRTRRQVKAKFILEEKKRPRLIELALNNKLNGNFDFENYCAESNKTFGTLNDFNAKLEQLKKDHEENLKELSIAREKAREEDTLRQKKKEEEVKAGVHNNKPLTRQERLMELRKNETVLGSIDDLKRKREEEAAAAAS